VERVRIQFAILAVLALATGDLGASTCVAPKPLRVAGAVCGKVFDVTGALVPNVELFMVDASGAVISRVHSDSNADFAFPSLAKGTYKVTSDAPWHISFGTIQVTNSKETLACKRPVYVYLGVGDCSGWVSRSKPKP
jgi:hypothetical protein